MNLLLHTAYRRSVTACFSITKCVYLSTATKIVHNDELLTKEEQLFKKHKNNVYYSDYLERNRLKLGYRYNVIAMDIAEEQTKLAREQSQHEPFPITLKYLGHSSNLIDENQDKVAAAIDSHLPPESHIHFPFKDSNASIEFINDTNANKPIVSAEDTNMEIRMRLELLNKSKDHLKWMNDYENFPLVQEVDMAKVGKNTTINYGTPNPDVPASKVPCGGCGALLHCRDTSIPGYIPSEIFTQYKQRGGIKLEGIHCQRCHFLEHYNMALQVRVSPEDYPKVLRRIGQQKRALVILMVDLLDFPCSIWPGISDLVGHGRPLIVVGNKVDLLPDDGKGYLRRVKENLLNSMKENGFATTNIQHVGLISAKTGFGIEDLITRLNSLWQYKGDVYIVGCTNVGKSSLFNALLQSDYCKHEAEDLLQRATTSPWPGTTLNLLKFPILRPTGWRLYVRHKRLLSNRRIEAQENELRQKLYRKTKNLKYASIIGNIERSFPSDEPVDDESTDIYAMKMSAHGGPLKPVGLDTRDERFALSKWCYDTPGVVQPEQIIHHFTTDELIKVFPNVLIKPRTFSLGPGASLFIGGIARFDYCVGDANCRFTVFASYQLPITICKTKEAGTIYDDLLRSDAFAVPIYNEERMRLWPGLQSSKCFSVIGMDRNTSCADLVLSSAGWVAITPETGCNCIIQGWTPEARGIYLRDCLLPNIVRYRGKKIRGSCAYKIHK